ncbi:MAG: YjgN family protein [Gammaproteobacteria bacterium]|nr:YjgN family protein [Gammaproteobacteria bacterium]
MEQQSFMLVFQGELVDGFELEQAKQNLRELFKVSQEKIEQLFSLRAVVVKKNLTHELAQQFQRQLQKHGLVTVIQPMSDTKVVEVSEEQMGDAAAGAPATQDVQALADGRPMPFRFEGKGGEYFKIWIVNVLLSIVTLGIYSAWAKVRNHRYFYSNTHIANHSFEYLAEPITILKGRIVAALFLAGYLLSGSFMPALQLAFMAVFVIALPWLVCKSMSFRNRNTAFRNIRFGFDGSYFEAFKAFVLWPLAGVLTIGLLLPYAFYRQKYFLVVNSRYGTTLFDPSFEARQFYGIFLRALGILILAILAALIPVIGPLITLALYLLVFAYVSANTTNLIYNNSTLQQHGFESRLQVGQLAWIYISNWFITAITLGLAMPWAKVRLANYHAQCLTLMTEGSIDEFVAAEEKSVSSLGEEIGDAFDMDIGL